MKSNGEQGPVPLRSLSGINPYEGVPIRGRPFTMKDDDPPHMQPKIKYEAHVKIFDLSNEEDMKAYEKIAQDAADEKVVVGIEEHRFCEDINTWRVLVRWYDQFLIAPEGDTGEQTIWS